MVAFLLRFVRVVVAVSFTCLGVQSLEAQPSSAIRILDSRLAAALRDALERSPTLQAIVGELEQSDLIVHVVARSASARHPHSGRLAFVTAAGGRRFVRITIDAHLAYAERAAILGHELYHAVEVAREAAVVDLAAFASFYRRVGHATDHGAHCFDTTGAQEAGRRVLAELKAASAARPTTAFATGLIDLRPR